MNHNNTLNKINSFKKFQAEIESKLCLLEDTTIAGKEAPTELQMINCDL